MKNFDYYAPTEVVFGRDTVEQAGRLVRKYGGSRVLIHFGGGSAVRSGLIDRVKASLDTEGLFHVELGGVVPNPHVGKVREGLALARENKIDFLLAVGGGSVIDSTKAIAYALTDPDEEVWDLFEKKRKASGCFPLGAILTIAAAGSEMSSSCVITNEETDEKRGYTSDLARPRFAVMDPMLTMTLPDYQTQAGCADILMHTMERYFANPKPMELTDAIAVSLLKTVMKHAGILHEEPENYESRAEVMWAGSLSHNGLTGLGGNGGDWSCHKLEHELGGLFDVTHGAGLAALWPTWARYVFREDLSRFVSFAVDVMGVERNGRSDEETALMGISAMEEFYHRIGMPTSLTELGVTPDKGQIRWMAESCTRAVGGTLGCVKKLDTEDMEEIYRRAI